MPDYLYILLLLALPLVLLGLWLCFRLGALHPRLDRSTNEVAETLRTIMNGGSTPHAVDNFECIPIKDARLDAVRERFVRLAAEFPGWIGDAPFPVEGRPRLQALIDEAESAAS